MGRPARVVGLGVKVFVTMGRILKGVAVELPTGIVTVLDVVPAIEITTGTAGPEATPAGTNTLT
jgi:hypothetical protein